MQSPPQRKAIRTLLAVALVLLCGALTACDPDQIGSAAIIGGKPLPVEELQESTQEFLEVVPGVPQGTAQSQVLESMVRSEVIAAAAERAGVSASEAEVAQVRDNAIRDFGGRTKLVRALAEGDQGQVIPPSHIERVARDVVLQNKIVEKIAAGRDPGTPEVGQDVRKAFRTAAQSLDIEINPRYGSWNAEDGALQASVGGGLSKSVNERAKAAADK